MAANEGVCTSPIFTDEKGKASKPFTDVWYAFLKVSTVSGSFQILASLIIVNIYF